MSFLVPICYNDTAIAYAIDIDNNESKKIQLQIGDIAFLMGTDELKSFLEVVKKSKKKCNCINCDNDKAIKTIKCDTPIAEIKFKVTLKMLVDLEDLISKTLFHMDYESLIDSIS